MSVRLFVFVLVLAVPSLASAQINGGGPLGGPVVGQGLASCPLGVIQGPNIDEGRVASPLGVCGPEAWSVQEAEAVPFVPPGAPDCTVLSGWALGDLNWAGECKGDEVAAVTVSGEVGADELGCAVPEVYDGHAPSLMAGVHPEDRLLLVCFD